MDAYAAILKVADPQVVATKVVGIRIVWGPQDSDMAITGCGPMSPCQPLENLDVRVGEAEAEEQQSLGEVRGAEEGPKAPVQIFVGFEV